jgi:hypothetical protein
MGIGQTLDAAIRLYRADWKTLMAIVAVIAVPFSVIQSFVDQQTQHAVLVGGDVLRARSSVGITALFFLISVCVITPLLRGSMVRAVAGIYLGERPGVSKSIRFAWSKLGWMLLGIVLATVIASAGLIALIVPGIILYVRYSFVASAVVVEGAKGNALGRSWRLSKGLGWHIFGTLLFALILAGIATVIFEVPILLLQLHDPLGTTLWVARAVLSSVSSVIVTPFTTIVGVLLYFDARIRKEAFDLAVMAQEVGSAPA